MVGRFFFRFISFLPCNLLFNFVATLGVQLTKPSRQNKNRYIRLLPVVMLSCLANTLLTQRILSCFSSIYTHYPFELLLTSIFRCALCIARLTFFIIVILADKETCSSFSTKLDRLLVGIWKQWV